MSAHGVTAGERVRSDTVFLFDVDNTLLDNDRFSADLAAELDARLGQGAAARYRLFYEGLRDELGYADYLGALQRLRLERDGDPAFAALGAWMLDYPFEQRLYPDALEAIAHLRTIGRAAILSDGDAVFQPRKIARSGLASAVGGNVLIVLHKAREMDLLQQRFPAAHYVMIDDKPDLLAAMKTALGAKLTSVFVQQGHYARDADLARIAPAPDRTIAHIGDLRMLDAGTFLPSNAATAAA